MVSLNSPPTKMRGANTTETSIGSIYYIVFYAHSILYINAKDMDTDQDAITVTSRFSNEVLTQSIQTSSKSLITTILCIPMAQTLHIYP
jgi:hypothetical protein